MDINKFMDNLISPISFMKTYRLLEESSLPNENIFDFEVTFYMPRYQSYIEFRVYVSESKLGELLGYKIVDKLGNNLLAFTDDILMPYFSVRDDRRLYYRNLRNIATETEW